MFLANFWVLYLTDGRTYHQVSKIPQRYYALVLGTSPKTLKGNANMYFVERMNAVATLYKHGKVRKIIVSGEKSNYYNEPKAMQNYLVLQCGVENTDIIQDTEGFNTQKSIRNLSLNPNYHHVIIVSQGFHNLRALFIARNYGVDAIAYDAQDVSQPKSYFRNHLREFLAKVKAVLYYIVSPVLDLK